MERKLGLTAYSVAGKPEIPHVDEAELEVLEQIEARLLTVLL